MAKLTERQAILLHHFYFSTLQDDCADFATGNNTLNLANRTGTTSAATEFWEYVYTNPQTPQASRHFKCTFFCVCFVPFQAAGSGYHRRD